jgi:hypothetical protein
MTRRKWSILMLLVLMLLLMGQAVYAQSGTQTANTSAPLSTSLQIDGMV